MLAAERQARAELDDIRDGGPPRRERIVLALAAVAALSGIIAAFISGRAPSDEDFQRAAAERVNLLLSSDPDQPDRAKRILAGATGEFHDEFAQSADAYTTFVRARGTVSDGRVQGTGMTARLGDQAEVLVLATVDLPASPQAPARSTDFRLRVVVADEDGVFKLAKVQYLP
nr:hypothetical protein [Gordonia araii]